MKASQWKKSAKNFYCIPCTKRGGGTLPESAMSVLME